MKSKNLLITSLLILGCFVLLKKRQNVAKVLPVTSTKPVADIKSNRKKISKSKKVAEKKPYRSQINRRGLDEKSIFKKGNKSKEIISKFTQKAYLDLPDLPGFDFGDFSEDNVAIVVGKNIVGDKLTLVAGRSVLETKDVIKTLSDDPTFLNSTDPDFRAELMQPVLNLGKRNGFSEVQVWKSTQNGKDYYMFYAPREDGRGAYGVLLDGKRDKLEANEDYYEEMLLKIRARKAN